MEIEEFNKVMANLENAFVLNKDNLEEKIQKVTLLQHQYSDLFIKEMKVLNKLDFKRKKKFGQLFEYYKYKSDLKWDTKGEIETQIQANDEYYKLCIEFSEQEAIAKHLEAAVENLKKFSFQIGNFINYLKFIGTGY